MSRLHGKLVIATHNAGKLREIAALLAPYGVECISAGDLDLEEPEEIHDTFIENAAQGARRDRSDRSARAGRRFGSVCGGAGGRPGVYTADWAERHWYEGPDGRDWYMAMGKVEGLLCEQGPDVAARCAFRLRSGDHLARRRACGL
jgi:XTP/dITP diphosphohydrolase